MIENRDYMHDEPARGRAFRFRGSASVLLMITLAVAFALQCVNDVYVRSWVDTWLALTPAALARGYVWQLLTFQFLHVDLWHLLGNLLGLWFFGRFVEQVLGTKRFLVAYLGAGILGGLLQCVLMLLFRSHFVPLVFGASAGVTGMFAIFCRLQAGSEIRWNFILPIRADVLLWITAGISLFFTLVPSQRGGSYAHAAHLGGILAGLAWVRLGWHRDYVTLPWENLLARWRAWRLPQARQRKRELVRAATVSGHSWQASAKKPQLDLPPEEFISQEVDPILDKISQQGIHSLTARERQILEAARKKMEKR
jgi:membrane associated rhomboid family serine protease